MGAIELPDQVLQVETVHEDDFSCETGDWVAEGGAEVSLRDGRLFMDATGGDPSSAVAGTATEGERPFLTLWCGKEFEGDGVIEFAARVEPGEGSTNINFFVYGTNPDGSSVLETTEGRTGEYPEYHRLNNYIYTFLNSDEHGSPQLRVRFRKDPGFNLLKEVWREPLQKGRDYRFAIAVQGPRMRYYVDGDLLVDYEDTDSPHRRGHHAFRTWHSHISAAYFRVSRIVSASPG